MSGKIYVNHFNIIRDGQSRPTVIVRAICIQPKAVCSDRALAETMDKVGGLAAAYIRRQFGDEARFALPAETNGSEVPQAIRVLSNAVELNWLVWGVDDEPFGE